MSVEIAHDDPVDHVLRDRCPEIVPVEQEHASDEGDKSAAPTTPLPTTTPSTPPSSSPSPSTELIPVAAACADGEKVEVEVSARAGTALLSPQSSGTGEGGEGAGEEEPEAAGVGSVAAVVEKTDERGIVVVGRVEKKGEYGLLGLGEPTYKPRWLRIENNVLHYFNSEREARNPPKLPSSSTREPIVLDRYIAVPVDSDGLGRKFDLQPIDISDARRSRPWHFRAESEADRATWIRALISHGAVDGTPSAPISTPIPATARKRRTPHA
jgi:PH domain